MLRFKAIVLLLALAIFSLSACKKDDNEDDNGPDNTFGTVSLKVDGNDWTSDFVISVYEEGLLTVTSSTNDGRACGIIVEATQPGTYEVGPGNSENFLSWAVGDGTVNTYAASSSGGSGTVTITELNNNRAKGTFEFTGVNFDQETKTITNGSFTANLSITDF